MIHYYAQKGMRPSEIFNASEGEKNFLYWSMLTAMELQGKLTDILA
jgi:hypothetical protein